MDRKFSEQLIDWKEKNIKEPLMVIGARQTGKTYIIDEFCKKNYENYIYLNFEDIANLSSIFEENLIPEEIIEKIEILIKKEINIENTIIFFDEIQICERAITSLKYFCEAKENYKIVCAGSLLGIKLHRFTSSFPVGKVRIVNMYPMDFEEFLWANEEKKLANMIRKYYIEKKQISELLHDKAMNYYLDYLYIGGMPQAVLNYIHNGKKILKFDRTIHNSIITSYIADMRKYTISAAETVKINEIYESIPRQLAKENTKFKYNIVNSRANKRDYELPLDWLVASSLVYRAIKVEKTQSPLKAFIDQNNFKIYLSDVGLLSTLAKTSYQDLKLEENNIFKGALTENYVAQSLACKGEELNYFKPTQTMEIDFLLNDNGNIIPIEVKSGTHVKSRSLYNYMIKYKPKYAIKISARNFGYKNGIFSVPLYAVFCIDKGNVC